METQVYKGYTITLTQDEDPEGPEAWGDANLFLVGYNSRYFSVDAPKEKGRVLFTRQDLLEYFDPDAESPEIFAGYHVFGLEAYIHSGVRLYLSGGCAIDRQWDVSQIGAVLVAREEWPDEDKAQDVARGLVKNWNQYLSGEVWILRVTDPEGKDIENCSGFYGSDYAEQEGRGIVDRCLKSNTDAQGNFVFPFYNETIKGAK